MKYLVGFLVVVVALAGGWLFIAWHWSYSSGERAGWVQKLSHKGWVCKTWEGELALITMPGGAQEKFFFTIHDDAVAEQLNRLMGRRVSLHYEEKVGLPTRCFGDTRHFVTRVVLTEDIPLGPGVVVPHGSPMAPRLQPPPSAPEGAAVSPPSPPSPQAPVTGTAPALLPTSPPQAAPAALAVPPTPPGSAPSR